MAHFYNEIEGIGENREQAQAVAVSEFLYEQGHRHSVRDVLNPVLVERVPPIRQVVKRVVPKPSAHLGVYSRMLVWNTGEPYDLVTPEPDPTAPESEWLEKWRFTLHTHA